MLKFKKINSLLSRQKRLFKILFFKVNSYLEKYRTRFFSFLIGFLMGRLINELANPDLKTIKDIWVSMFSISRPLNWSTWLFLAGIVILICLTPIAKKLKRQLRDKSTLLTILEGIKDPPLRKYNAIGVDKAITLQLCPEPDRGWVLSESEVCLRHDTVGFELPQDVCKTYIDYKNDHHFDKKFMDDKRVLMLTKNPRAFTDMPTLVLNTKEVLFSKVLFFRERLLREKPDFLEGVIDSCVMGAENISFPHRLNMHIVVVTQDGRVLITKRSTKVEWYKDKWSCSFEEAFSLKDLEEGRRGVDALKHWVTRALREELGLDEKSYAVENVRILSVFLESNVSEEESVLNIALCTLVTLDVEHRELSTILKVLPRPDYEFTDFDFLDNKTMVAELIHATRQYHPTSRYRMLLSLIHKYGEADFARRFLSLAAQVETRISI